MNAGELRKALEGVADKMPVCVTGGDHSYTVVGRRCARVVEAHDQDGDYGEYGGVACEPNYGPKVSVFLVGE